MSQHESQVVIVRCPDDNYSEGKPLNEGFEKIVATEGAEVRYEPNAFGGALEFVLPRTQEAWRWRFEVAATLKPAIKRIVVINHTPNCGAVTKEYGPFNSPEEEKAKHVELLRRAMDFVIDNVPGLEYVGYLQEGDNYTKICEHLIEVDPEDETVEAIPA